MIIFYVQAEACFKGMALARGKLSYVGLWKEYIKAQEVTLFGKIKSYLKPKQVEEAENSKVNDEN